MSIKRQAQQEKVGPRRIRITIVNGVKKVTIIGHDGVATACHLNNKELVELLAKKRAPGHGGRVGETNTSLTTEGKRALEDNEVQYEMPQTQAPSTFEYPENKDDNYDERQLDKGYGV